MLPPFHPPLGRQPLPDVPPGTHSTPTETEGQSGRCCCESPCRVGRPPCRGDCRLREGARSRAGQRPGAGVGGGTCLRVRGDSGPPRHAPRTWVLEPSLPRPSVVSRQRPTRSRAAPGSGDQVRGSRVPAARPRPALRSPWSSGSASWPPGPLHPSRRAGRRGSAPEGPAKPAVPTRPATSRPGPPSAGARARDEGDAGGKCPFLFSRPFSLPAWIPALPELSGPIDQVPRCRRWGAGTAHSGGPFTGEEDQSPNWPGDAVVSGRHAHWRAPSNPPQGVSGKYLHCSLEAS